MSDSNPLATRPVGNLIASYAIPSIIAMVVNSLYNIVDQIFIGHGVGYLGNAATTIAFPVVTIGLSISLVFGTGCAAFISLKLGEGDRSQANRAFGSTVSLLVIVSVIFSILLSIFLSPLLQLLGATPNIWDYSYSYISIILLGQPFVVLSTALSHNIRTDGNPKYAMISVLIGAILNTILDPIFIFAWNMGVEGAAIATVISQVVSFLLTAVYFARNPNFIRPNRHDFLPDFSIIRSILALGFSSFINQLSITIVSILLNNTLRHYGSMSPVGSEIPISAMGIVQKVSGIMISMLVGLAVGSQPILGYNYGAKNYTRVRRTYFISVLFATITSVAGYMVFQLVPHKIIAIFGDHTPAFVEFGSLSFRLFLGGIFVAGFQMITTQYYQATGRAGMAALLSLFRQILFLFPLVFLFAYTYGLVGILYAGMIADILSAIAIFIIILFEMRRLNNKISSQTT